MGRKTEKSNGYMWFLCVLILSLLVVVGLMSFGIIPDCGTLIASTFNTLEHADLVTVHTAAGSSHAGYDTSGTLTTGTGTAATYAPQLQTLLGAPTTTDDIGNNHGLWISKADIHGENGMCALGENEK